MEAQGQVREKLKGLLSWRVFSIFIGLWLLSGGYKWFTYYGELQKALLQKPISYVELENMDSMGLWLTIFMITAFVYVLSCSGDKSLKKDFLVLQGIGLIFIVGIEIIVLLDYLVRFVMGGYLLADCPQMVLIHEFSWAELILSGLVQMSYGLIWLGLVGIISAVWRKSQKAVTALCIGFVMMVFICLGKDYAPWRWITEETSIAHFFFKVVIIYSCCTLISYLLIKNSHQEEHKRLHYSINAGLVYLCVIVTIGGYIFNSDYSVLTIKDKEQVHQYQIDSYSIEQILAGQWYSEDDGTRWVNYLLWSISGYGYTDKEYAVQSVTINGINIGSYLGVKDVEDYDENDIILLSIPHHRNINLFAQDLDESVKAIKGNEIDVEMIFPGGPYK